MVLLGGMNDLMKVIMGDSDQVDELFELMSQLDDIVERYPRLEEPLYDIIDQLYTIAMTEAALDEGQ